jgi:hypothetical protein
LFQKSRRGERFPLSRGIIIVYRVLIIVLAHRMKIPGPFKKKAREEIVIREEKDPILSRALDAEHMAAG